MNKVIEKEELKENSNSIQENKEQIENNVKDVKVENSEQVIKESLKENEINVEQEPENNTITNENNLEENNQLSNENNLEENNQLSNENNLEENYQLSIEDIQKQNIQNNVEINTNEVQENDSIDTEVSDIKTEQNENSQEQVQNQQGIKIENNQQVTNIQDLVKADSEKSPQVQNTYDKPKKKGSILKKIFLSIIFILLAVFIIFTYSNIKNDKIYSNIYVQGIDVSGLTREEAKEKVSKYINERIPEEIVLKHNDYETSISTEDLGLNFDIDSAVGWAYNLGRTGNIFSNDLQILEIKLLKEDVKPYLQIDNKKLTTYLEAITAELPDRVEESGYYIEDGNLIITKGKTGQVVDVDKTTGYIKNQIEKLEFSNIKLEIITKTKNPKKIDMDDIYSKVHKDAQDAYFTQDPFAIYPSEEGVDFDISIDEAKALLDEEKDEYTIPLKTLYPNVTTNMIGTEAFPDVLSTFSTNYVRNANRTTNLILASNKINGTVVMPGDTFSYNKVVGARTIAAGYKEAAIYVNGKVEDGLGGGICQVATTLYNAAVYANLEIVERGNHQFVPTYVGPSRDATVVYGAIDFQFKNNRNYPIKISSSVANGVVYFEIRGLRTDNDYDVEITTAVTSRSANTINSVAYKTLKQNGQVVSSEVLSQDTYKRH